MSIHSHLIYSARFCFHAWVSSSCMENVHWMSHHSISTDDSGKAEREGGSELCCMAKFRLPTESWLCESLMSSFRTQECSRIKTFLTFWEEGKNIVDEGLNSPCIFVSLSLLLKLFWSDVFNFFHHFKSVREMRQIDNVFFITDFWTGRRKDTRVLHLLSGESTATRSAGSVLKMLPCHLFH